MFLCFARIKRDLNLEFLLVIIHHFIRRKREKKMVNFGDYFRRVFWGLLIEGRYVEDIATS